MYDFDVEIERRAFRQFLSLNPNHFGNLTGVIDLPGLPAPGTTLKASTKYEEIGCVGYDPVRDRLDAVVYVKQTTGYGTSLCGTGTPEYVRFYLSFDDGTTWVDKGVVAFQAYNIPEGTWGRKRLEYAASLRIDELRRFCTLTTTVLCRAILSWNFEPPPDTPDFVPVWGEVHDTHLLTEPYRFTIPFGDWVKAVDLQLPEGVLDLEAQPPLTLKPAKPLPFDELASLSKKAGVKPLRYAFPEVVKQSRLAGLGGLTKLGSPGAAKASDAKALGLGGGGPVPGVPFENPLLDVDLQDLILEIDEALQGAGDGNTTYEELECVGLFPNENLLVGTVRIKRPTGFNGGPCTAGSRQYVAFWADLDDDGDFDSETAPGVAVPEYLGTVSFPVYDIADFPDGGLEYAVSLPADFAKYQRPCEDGPVLIKVRAILSWSQPLGADDYDTTPVWGNRVETVVHVKPGPVLGQAGGLLSIVGGVALEHIGSDGLTTPNAAFALTGITLDGQGRGCPFGGLVTVQGYGGDYAQYKVSVREKDTTAWLPVTSPITVVNQYGVTATHAADANDRFSYLPHQDNVASLLARWATGGDSEWDLRIETWASDGTPGPTQQVHLQLDNTWPEADIEITSGGGNCGKFGPADPISGFFIARDDYFGSYSVAITPNKGGVQLSSDGSPPATTLSGTTQTPTGGRNWALDATNMPTCGYNVRLTVRDRAVVNSSTVGHHRTAVEGFCID